MLSRMGILRHDTISLNDTERVAVDGEDEVSVLGRRLSIRYIRSSSPHTQEMDTAELRDEREVIRAIVKNCAPRRKR